MLDNWFNDVENNLVKAGIEFNLDNKYMLNNKGIYENNKECYVCYSSLEDLKKLSIKDLFKVLNNGLDFSDLSSNNFSSNLKCDSKMKTFENYKGTDLLQFYFSLSCNHNLCCECWFYYVDNNINDYLNIVKTLCPQENCNLIVPESVYKAFFTYYSINNNNDFTKLKLLKKGILKNFTDCNKNLKWCPAPNCNNCITCMYNDVYDVKCDCGFIFCFSCLEETHRPCSCDMVRSWEIKNKSDGLNVTWLLANAKKCPNCKKYIEKNKGCNHMTCMKAAGGCGYEFCWICLKDWNSHDKDYYKCNKFEENTDTNVSNAKYEIERYAHYFDRFNNHNNSIKYAQKLKTVIKEKMLIFTNKLKKNLEEVYFFENSVDIVIKARLVLKNTYILGYYLGNYPQKQLFEHQQHLLEKNADLLHEYLEDDKIDSIILITNFVEFDNAFYSLKSKITDLSEVTNKYMQSIVKEIEVNIIDKIDYNKIK